jgi:hypothetical protein
MEAKDGKKNEGLEAGSRPVRKKEERGFKTEKEKIMSSTSKILTRQSTPYTRVK